MLTRERIVELVKDYENYPTMSYDTLADAILAEMEEPKPHIICLAAAKHYRLRPAMTARAWIISLVKIGDRADKFVAKGETYWDAEAKARAYLAGLPNVERGGK